MKYVILFEGTNDLGGSRDGVATAEQIKAVFRDIIREAHERGIRVIGATVTSAVGSFYQREGEHEKGRQALNAWIRESGEFDGVIDFDKITAGPDDPTRINPAFLFENDWLHLNADGYRLMGTSIDRSLFY